MLLFLLGMAAGAVVFTVVVFLVVNESDKKLESGRVYHARVSLNRINDISRLFNERVDNVWNELHANALDIGLLKARTESLLEYANSCIDCHETAFHAPPAAQAKPEVIKKDKKR